MLWYFLAQKTWNFGLFWLFWREFAHFFNLNNPVAHQKWKISGMATIDILVKRYLIKDDDDKDFAMMWWDSSSPWFHPRWPQRLPVGLANHQIPCTEALTSRSFNSMFLEIFTCEFISLINASTFLGVRPAPPLRSEFLMMASWFASKRVQV